MAIRTRTSDGYQQVELTSELLHSQSGTTQQVISTVPCTKHLPFFFSILLADLFLFGSIILFAVYAANYNDGFSIDKQPESPYRQFNAHALVMLTALIYLNGQAITVYKCNYLIKHKSVNMLYHFVLHLLTAAGILGGIYLTYNAQEALQAGRPKVSHFYSIHSWSGLVAVALFALQFLFGFFSFFVTLCCRKLTARMRARALPAHRTFAMIVLSASTAAVISGLSQLARFQMSGQDGRPDYRDWSVGSLLVNLSAVCVLASMVLIFLLTFLFKRRQAHDLPVLFKIVLLVTRFIEIVLVLVVAEFVLQVVTPHVNKVINSQFIGNTTINHIINNATQTFNSFITSAGQHIASVTGNRDASNTTTTLSPTDVSSSSNSSIIIGSSS